MGDATPLSARVWQTLFEGNLQAALDLTRSCRRRGQADSADVDRAHHPVATFIEPALSSRVGHHYHLAMHYGQVLRAAGFQTIVLHAHDHASDDRPGWYPYFVVSHTTGRKAIASGHQLGLVERYFTAEYEEILDRYDPSLCVFGTARFTTIRAAATALAGGERHRRRQAVFGVLEADDPPDACDPGIVRGAWSRAAAVLHDHDIPHRMVVETEQIRSFLIECGFSPDDTKLYQYVAAGRIAKESPTSGPDGDCVTVGYVGGSRPVRRPETIADVLCGEAFPPHVRWKVQLDLRYVAKHRGVDLVRRLRDLHEGGVVELFPTDLEEERYRSLFHSLDFVVMPYSDRYERIGSGVLIEAIYCGVVPIVPARSSMHRLYASLGGEPPTFDGGNPSSVRTAILDGLSRREALKAQAQLVRDRWADHPQSSERWQADLEEWIARSHT